MNRSGFRIAVIGGGPVGCLAALELARLGFAVTLFDRREPAISRGRLGIDIRNFALSPASQAQLAAVNVWDGLAAAPYSSMRVWEEWGVNELCFTADEAGRSELGWVVEASPVNELLWEALQSAGVTLVVGDIGEVEAGEDCVRIDATEADFLVGADGADSLVRRSLGVPLVERPTGQSALATVVRTECRHEDTAWQRFLHDGPLALLPSPDPNVCSVVWSQSPAHAQERQALDEASFLDCIGRAFEFRLGDVIDVDERFVFPLSQQRVTKCVPHPRVVLIGDAMRVIHPLAGLGVNLGLEDVRELVKVAERRGSLAGFDVWQRFAARRQARSEMMMRVMAALKGVYSQSTPLIGWLRNVGVGLVDAQPWLKQPLMREALGLSEHG